MLVSLPRARSGVWLATLVVKMASFSRKHSVFTVHKGFKCKNVKQVLRNYRQYFNGENAPSINCVINLVK